MTTIRLVSVIRRRKGMTQEEFDTYWRDVHGPMVSKHAQLLGIRRYSQVHLHPELRAAWNANRGSEEDDFDGIAIVEFENEAAATPEIRPDTTPEQIEAIKEISADEPNWVDLRTSHQFVGLEEVFVDRSSELS